MREFLEQCVERYQELASVDKALLKKVETPFLKEAKKAIDEASLGDKEPARGKLGSVAAAILMKCLYAARNV